MKGPGSCARVALSALLLGNAALAQAEPEVAWTADLGASRPGGLLVRDGGVFTFDRGGSRVVAFDAATGEARWTSPDRYYAIDGFGLTMPEGGDGSVLYVGSDRGLSALDVADGTRRWHTAIDGGVNAPACIGGAVVAGAFAGRVVACDRASGDVLWEHDLVADRPDDPEAFPSATAKKASHAARPGPLAAGGGLVVVPIFDQCRVVAVDAATGARKWAYRAGGWVWPRPAIGPRNVYVSSHDGAVHAVDRETGKLAWRLETGEANNATALATGRFAYVPAGDAHLYAVDMVVGQVRWKYETAHAEGRGAPMYARPVVLGDVVYVAAMQNEVYAVDRESGALRWRICPVEGAEIIGDLETDGERLFVTTRKVGKKGRNAVVAITMPTR